MSRIRTALLGPPLPTQGLLQEQLNKIRALATFSPDALSSVAYANQEIYLALVVAGSAGLKAALLYRRRHLGYQRAIIDVAFRLRR